MNLCAIEIDDGGVEIPGTARACISGNRSETIGITPDEEEMIPAVGPEMNACLGDAGGRSEDEDAPGFTARSLCVATVGNRRIRRGNRAHRMNPCPPTTRSQKLEVSAGSLKRAKRCHCG